jgi:hypothetical protein
MSHLHTERLAALSDAPATADEASHLASCAACAAEARAYDSLLLLAGAEHDVIGLPLTRWDSIAAALEKEAVARAVLELPVARRSNRAVLQVAAGLLLVAGGAIMGRVSTGASPIPGDGPAVTTTAQGNSIPDSNFILRTPEEARALQQRSEALYQQATAYLARNDSSGIAQGSPVAYRSRLSALDRMISTAREAMQEAPHDPVINGYYLNTLGQREATLRQLNTVLPASMHVNSF